LPDQIPAAFKISPLPKKVLSWVAAVLRMHKLYLTGNKRAPTSPKTAVGNVGSACAQRLGLPLTPSSLRYPNKKSTSLPSLLSLASEQLLGLKKENLQALVNEQWLRALSEQP
jgi:hypothetical protein